MLLVVIYHCILYWNGSWFVGEPVYSAPALGIISQWLNSFHIYAFALVSGYLFYYLKYEKGKYSAFIPFVKNKAKRLLVPYLFVSVVWVIPFAVAFFGYGPFEIFKRFALGTSPNQLWFLLMLFGVFVIFYPLSSFFAKHTFIGAALAIVLYGMGLIGPSILPNVFQVFRALQYIPLFWIGFKLRQYGSAKLRKIPTPVWIVADILVFVAGELVSKFDGAIFSLLNLGVSFVLHIIGALMAFFVLQKIADKTKWAKSAVFAHLSKNSMPIYLFHQRFVYLSIYFLNGIINPYAHAVVNVAFAMSASLLLSFLLMKFRLTRSLIGEK